MLGPVRQHDRNPRAAHRGVPQPCHPSAHVHATLATRSSSPSSAAPPYRINPKLTVHTPPSLPPQRYTTLTTPLFIHEATRPLSTWQLAPLSTPPSQAYPDIVAQTEDKHGKVLGRWDGEREEGKVVKTFMVHEDLLEGIWGLDGWRSHKSSDIP